MILERFQNFLKFRVSISLPKDENNLIKLFRRLSALFLKLLTSLWHHFESPDKSLEGFPHYFWSCLHHFESPDKSLEGSPRYFWSCSDWIFRQEFRRLSMLFLELLTSLWISGQEFRRLSALFLKLLTSLWISGQDFRRLSTLFLELVRFNLRTRV